MHVCMEGWWGQRGVEGAGNGGLSDPWGPPQPRGYTGINSQTARGLLSSGPQRLSGWGT